MYNMGIMVNNKVISLVTDGNEIYPSDLFLMYTKSESLDCAPGTNTAL